MKHTIKKFKFILYFCLATFLLNSCTQEKEYLEHDNREIKVIKKPLKELLMLNDFNKAYQKVKTEKQRNSAARSAIEDEFNFTIAEDKEVNVVEADGATFYNILVTRDSINSTYFENLLIKLETVNNEEESSAYIVKYFSPNEINILNVENNTEINQLYGRSTIVKRTVCVTLCNALTDDHPINHLPYSNACYDHLSTQCWDYYDMNSEDDGGGGNIGSSPSGNGVGGNPNAGGGSNSGTPLVTTPVYGGSITNELEDITFDCEKIKKISNQTNIKSAIYQTNLNTNDNIEHGFSFKKNSTNYITNELIAYENTIQIPTGNDYFAAVHSHRDMDYGMFSWADLYTLYNLYKNTNVLNKSEVTFILTCGNGAYALKISNWQNFRKEIGPIINIMDENKRNIAIESKNNDLNNFVTSSVSTTSDNMESGFLQYIKEKNIGISLFKTESNDFSPNALVKWNKLNLNESNPNLSPEKQPCNP